MPRHIIITAALAGCKVATPTEARELLSLPSKEGAA